MEKIIQFLVTNQSDAKKAVSTLNKLDDNDDIDLAEVYVLSKSDKGKVSVRDSEDSPLADTAFGSLTGGLIGTLLLAVVNPAAGFLLGASTGALFGAIGDADRADTADDYLQAVGKKIPNGSLVVVAHVYEDSTAPIDTSIGAYAEIYRVIVDEDVEKELDKEDEELDKEIDETKRSLKTAVDKEKFQLKLAELKAKRKSRAEERKAKLYVKKQAYKTWWQKTKDNVKAAFSK